ncbi:hypothetical protein ABZ891_23220 [Streptomyces sp. NPDC047023]|uniref:hypothetical protein n=1 Tax=Streptomyces sp. NPDC047023 TaxID=3155139 RepID=UPI0034065511
MIGANETNGEGWCRQLLAAVALLAASAPDQLAWLEKHAVPVDEIALNFEDAAVMAPQLGDVGGIAAEALSDIARMNDPLDRLAADGAPPSGPPDGSGHTNNGSKSVRKPNGSSARKAKRNERCRLPGPGADDRP